MKCCCCHYSPKTVYFASSLFSLQELVGNQVLADAIQERSDMRYKLSLPQNNNVPRDANATRQLDLQQILKSDAIIANFNGLDLDDGVVVELMAAVFTAKRCVVLKTDYRIFSETFSLNPLLLNLPGVQYVFLDALALSKIYSLDKVTEMIADAVVSALDKAFASPTTLDKESQRDASRILNTVLDLDLEI